MPVSQLPNLIYIFIIFVYVPHTLYTQSPPLASVHILYHIACRLNEDIRVMTVCTSATVATLIISCRLTAPCGHSHYDSLHKCNCRNAHYIMIRTYGAFRCCRNYHDPIRRSPIMQACWLTCAHYIMSPVGSMWAFAL